MALYNEILVGRFNRALQKVFGMKGGPPAPQLASEIGPTVAMFYGVENRYLEGWNRFGGAFFTPASVGNMTCTRIRNPAGSNVIIVIEKLLVSHSAGFVDQVLLVHGTAVGDLGAINSTLFARIDPRGNPQPTAILSTQNSAPTAPLLTNQQSLIGVQFNATNANWDFITFEEQELNLLPGDAYQVNNQTVNGDQTSNIIWRERFLEDSERT
jgi:hypothetical protein